MLTSQSSVFTPTFSKKNAGVWEFAFNGQAKDDEVAGAGNTNTALFWEYDTRIGRRWNLDPEIKQKPNFSPYQTFNDNPVIYVDYLGDRESPVFDKTGKLLGTDDQGMSGEIIIANDPLKFKQGMKHQDAEKIGSSFDNDRKDLAYSAKVKIVSKVLEGTRLPNGKSLEPKNYSLTLENDPNGLGEYKFYDPKYDIHYINLSLHKTDWTVENIRLVGGVHEIFGHGMMSWGDRFGGGGSHYKIYESEMNSIYWNKSSLSIKKNTVNNYWKYLYYETHAKSIPEKYKDKYIKYKN